MQSELLFTIGEIAVAFAGFAGLVVALARRGDRSTEEAQLDVVHLKSVLAQSLFAVAFAILPAMLDAMGVGADTAWRSSAILFAVLYGLYMARIVPAGNAGFRNSGQRVPVLFRVNSVIAFAVVAVLVLCGDRSNLSVLSRARLLSLRVGHFVRSRLPLCCSGGSRRLTRRCSWQAGAPAKWRVVGSRGTRRSSHRQQYAACS